MAFKLLWQWLKQPWLPKRTVASHQRNPHGLDHHLAARIIGKAKADLAATGQFDIKLGQKFGIKQRAMLGPVAAVYAVAAA